MNGDGNRGEGTEKRKKGKKAKTRKGVQKHSEHRRKASSLRRKACKQRTAELKVTDLCSLAVMMGNPTHTQ